MNAAAADLRSDHTLKLQMFQNVKSSSVRRRVHGVSQKVESAALRTLAGSTVVDLISAAEVRVDAVRMHHGGGLMDDGGAETTCAAAAHIKSISPSFLPHERFVFSQDGRETTREQMLRSVKNRPHARFLRWRQQQMRTFCNVNSQKRLCLRLR